MIEEIQEVQKALHSYLETDLPFSLEMYQNQLIIHPELQNSLEDRIENAKLLSQFFCANLQKICLEHISEKDFEALWQSIDESFYYIEQVAKGLSFDQEKEVFAHALCLKLGGKVPVQWLLEEENQDFWDFLLENHLHHQMFALRLHPFFQKEKGAYVPVQKQGVLTWIAWKDLEKRALYTDRQTMSGYGFFYQNQLLFQTRPSFRLERHYHCLCKGISQHDTFLDPLWEPYDYKDPALWGHEYMIEIWIVSMKGSQPSMFRNTHAYFNLYSKQGEIRSAGQDILLDFQNFKMTEMLSCKDGSGKIATPDKYVFYPRAIRDFWKVRIRLTKEEHDAICKIVEKDKQEKKRSMSVLRGNCVSYVLKILQQGAGISINASMHGMHIFAKHCLPHKVYQCFFYTFYSWYTRRSKGVQRLLYFVPIFYVPYLFFGCLAYLTNFNGFLGKSDFSLKDVFLHPDKLSCDHPWQLRHKLDLWVQYQGRHRLVL